MKIGILVNEETMKKCTGNGCFKAFNQRKDSFERYKDDSELELLTFTHAGNLDQKITKMIKQGVEVVHLSTCLRGKASNYEEMAEKLSKHFHVVGYTHGSKVGKTREAIILNRKEA